MNWFRVFRLFRKAPDARRPSPRRRPASFRPRLEALEDRCVPSTLVVTSPLDNANMQGTLRYDIAHASSGDTILISPALCGSPIVLTQGELYLNKDLTIEGLLQVPETISGGGNSQVFEVAAGAHVTLKDLNITAGRDPDGGGILNFGSLTISNSTLSGNTAEMSGGGIYNAYSYSLTVSNTDFCHNHSDDIFGGYTDGGGNTFC